AKERVSLQNRFTVRQSNSADNFSNILFRQCREVFHHCLIVAVQVCVKVRITSVIGCGECEGADQADGGEDRRCDLYRFHPFDLKIIMQSSSPDGSTRTDSAVVSVRWRTSPASPGCEACSSSYST